MKEISSDFFMPEIFYRSCGVRGLESGKKFFRSRKEYLDVMLNLSKHDSKLRAL